MDGHVVKDLDGSSSVNIFSPGFPGRIGHGDSASIAVIVPQWAIGMVIKMNSFSIGDKCPVGSCDGVNDLTIMRGKGVFYTHQSYIAYDRLPYVLYSSNNTGGNTLTMILRVYEECSGFNATVYFITVTKMPFIHLLA